MATIAIAPLQELGHVVPTFQIAKALRAAGHRVVYVGLEDHRAIVEGEGFAYVAIARGTLGLGALARGRARARDRRSRAIVRAIEAEWRSIIAPALLFGDEDATLAAIGADVALLDRDWEEMVLAFVALGVRIVQHTVTLYGTFAPRLRDRLADLEVPPLSATTPPGSRLRTLLAWARHDARELVALGLREAIVARLHGARTPRLLARRRDLRATLARAAVPTLVLCPEELDFPRRAGPAGVEYCGPCIDETRREPAQGVAIDPDRALVYASVGTQGHRFGAGNAFVRATIAAARDRAWQLVFAVGDSIELATLGPLPPNVVLVRHAPQLAILARAAAAIVHGGLGTIKECIWFEVPMLVVPGDHDQPGNAARVAYHGLGIAGIGDGRMAAQIDELLVDRARRDRLADFARRFRVRERELHHVRVIEAACASAAAIRH